MGWTGYLVPATDGSRREIPRAMRCGSRRRIQNEIPHATRYGSHRRIQNEIRLGMGRGESRHGIRHEKRASKSCHPQQRTGNTDNSSRRNKEPGKQLPEPAHRLVESQARGNRRSRAAVAERPAGPEGSGFGRAGASRL